MKFALTIVVFMAALCQAQIPSQSPSGLQIVSLKVKTVKRDNAWHPQMVSLTPPQLNPTLGRGTGDATDSERVADLKRKQEDRQRPQGGLVPFPAVKNPAYRPSVVTLYSLTAGVKNTSTKTITRFVWAYRLPESPGLPITQAQYLCAVKIAPGETTQVKVLSPIPRPRVVDARATNTQSSPHEPVLEDIRINQIEFADGEKWQQSDWNSIILTRLGARKLGKGKCIAL